MSMLEQEEVEQQVNIQKQSDEPMQSSASLFYDFLAWLSSRFIFFIPQIAVFVFIGVCVIAVFRNHGSDYLLLSLLPIFLANLVSVYRVYRDS